MKKQGLSLERHKEIGKELFEMRESLGRLLVEIGHAYPVTGERGRQFYRLNRALRELDMARSVLEDRCFEDCGSATDLNIYYGHGHDRSKAS